MASSSVSLSNSAEPAIQPKATQKECTRGTNPYQDMRDELLLIQDQLQKVELERDQHKQTGRKRAGSILRHRWKKFIALAESKSHSVPQEVRKEIDSQIAALLEHPNSGKTLTTEMLKKTHDLINNFSQTLTCPVSTQSASDVTTK
ncbi:MAG: hypothetical protein NT027_00945 [Proteobacteria bacterium]|nr:hypothetical protein [Pseudomonadota bacterium]